MGAQGKSVSFCLWVIPRERSDAHVGTVWSSEAEPQLARFKGRPGELSPKARFWLFAGWLLPTRFK